MRCSCHFRRHMKRIRRLCSCLPTSLNSRPGMMKIRTRQRIRASTPVDLKARTWETIPRSRPQSPALESTRSSMSSLASKYSMRATRKAISGQDITHRVSSSSRLRCPRLNRTARLSYLTSRVTRTYRRKSLNAWNWSSKTKLLAGIHDRALRLSSFSPTTTIGQPRAITMASSHPRGTPVLTPTTPSLSTSRPRQPSAEILLKLKTHVIRTT